MPGRGWPRAVKGASQIGEVYLTVPPAAVVFVSAAQSTPSTMASEDLLARLTLLHKYVDRELQGVFAVAGQIAVTDSPALNFYAAASFPIV